MEDQTTAGSGGTWCVDPGARLAGRWRGPAGPDPTVQVEGIAPRATVGEDNARSCSRRGRCRERRPVAARDAEAGVATRDAEAAAVRDAGIHFFRVATRD
jgi:hypothetical protein